MPVEIRSPKKKLVGLDATYDPMVAAENGAQFWVKCDNCGKEKQGTTDELSEKFGFEFTIDEEAVEITESEATCVECNEEVDTDEEGELKPYEKPRPEKELSDFEG